MRFGYRRTIIILVLAVAVVAVGASMLFAAPNADVERDEALKSLAVLNRYFQNQPTPSLAPTPAHTPVPTDSPPDGLMLLPSGQRGRSRLVLPIHQW